MNSKKRSTVRIVEYGPLNPPKKNYNSNIIIKHSITYPQICTAKKIVFEINGF